jgi:ribose-phosphate pyrophosphokinase
LATFFSLPGNEQLAMSLAELTSGEVGRLELRHFPDGETYVRVPDDLDGAHAFVVCSLARPDDRLVPLAFTAAAIRERGATSVELIAPYLAYMRPDRIFRSGEVLTSRLFATLLQQHFDRLVTVDPHLHRTATLDEIFDIPTTVVSSAPLFAEWIASNVPQPVIVGPDAESGQWVEAIANQVGAPWTRLTKERRGDRKVRIAASCGEEIHARTPVIVDDIVSSGATMREALRALMALRARSAYCLAIHALCSTRVAHQLSAKSLAFMTSNTVRNPNAVFDVAPVIAEALSLTAAGSRAAPTATSKTPARPLSSSEARQRPHC